MKKYLIIILAIVTLFLVSTAKVNASVAVGWSATSTTAGLITPNAVNGLQQGAQVQYLIATSSTETSTFSGPVTIGTATTSPNAIFLNVLGNTNIIGGLSTGSWTDPINDYFCAGTIASTTGTISLSSNQLTLANASGWFIGMGINITNASTSSTDLLTQVTNVNGNILTLAIPATNGVTNAIVRHDDTVCLQNAISSPKNVHIRAGNYNITGTITATTSKIIEGDGETSRQNISTGSALTNIIQNASTTNTFDIKVGYVNMGLLSIKQSSTTLATAGYALNFVTSGSTNDRQENIHDLLIYATSGGISIGTATTSDALSNSEFKNIFITTASSSPNNCIYLNNPAPAGDLRWSDIDCRTELGGAAGTGAGIRLSAADTSGWTNIKILSHSPDILIDAATGVVDRQRFVNNSLENGASTTGAIAVLNAVSTSTISEISFIASEFGINAGNIGISIGSSTFGTVLSGNAFAQLTTAIDLTNAVTNSGTQIVANSHTELITNYIVNPKNLPVLILDYATSTLATTTFTGFVGIGSSSPQQNLVVITGTTTGGIYVGPSNNGSSVSTSINTNGTNASFIRSNISRTPFASDAVSSSTLPSMDLLMNDAAGNGGAMSTRFFAPGSVSVGTSTLTILGNGQVGINMSAPTTILQAVGSTIAQSTFLLQNTSATSTNYPQIFLGTSASAGTLTVGAAIRAIRTNAITSGDTDLVLLAGSSSTQVEGLRILSNGNVGIGTTTSESYLANGRKTVIISDTTNSTELDMYGASGSIGSVSLTGSGFSLTSRTAIPITFGTNGTEAVGIDTSQRVGVGTSTPDSKLDVNGNVRFEGTSAVVTPSIGGAIVGFGCDTATSSVDATVSSSTVFLTTPQTFPGAGIYWNSYLSAAGVITTQVCSPATITPVTSTYNIRIIK